MGGRAFATVLALAALLGSVAPASAFHGDEAKPVNAIVDVDGSTVRVKALLTFTGQASDAFRSAGDLDNASTPESRRAFLQSEADGCFSRSTGPRLTVAERSPVRVERSADGEDDWVPRGWLDESVPGFGVTNLTGAPGSQVQVAIVNLECHFRLRTDETERVLTVSGLPPGTLVQFHLLDGSHVEQFLAGDDPAVTNLDGTAFVATADPEGRISFSYDRPPLPLRFDLLALADLGAAALAFSFAGLLLWSAPPRGLGRRLACVMALDGVAAMAAAVLYFLFEASIPDALKLTFGMACTTALVVYVWFALGLETPLARRVRGRLVLYVALAGGAALTAILVPRFEGLSLLYFLLGTLVPLAIAYDYYRTALTVRERRKARAYLVAFGTRDILVSLAYAVLILLAWTPAAVRFVDFGVDVLGLPHRADDLWVRLLIEATEGVGLLPLTLYFFVPLVAYGILKEQLFDLDVKLKRTIDRLLRYTLAAPPGTLAFFLVQHGLDQTLSSPAGDIGGGLAAALIAYLVANWQPVRGLGSKAGAAAVPSADVPAEVRNALNLEKYRAVVEHLIRQSGSLAPEDRVYLVKLQARYAIDMRDATRIESEVQGGAGAPVRVPADDEPAPA